MNNTRKAQGGFMRTKTGGATIHYQRLSLIKLTLK
uniref:Uncharacterized protein n=1 Tax=Anguilla anguilla TaxID=7936 RepID=A0A0E9VV98_ANGAN